MFFRQYMLSEVETRVRYINHWYERRHDALNQDRLQAIADMLHMEGKLRLLQLIYNVERLNVYLTFDKRCLRPIYVLCIYLHWYQALNNAYYNYTLDGHSSTYQSLPCLCLAQYLASQRRHHETLTTATLLQQELDAMKQVHVIVIDPLYTSLPLTPCTRRFH